MFCINSNIFYWETNFVFYVDHMALVYLQQATGVMKDIKMVVVILGI
jgi:hypothetical protein